MSSPRIIAGIARGIRIKSVPGDSTRPITDRVKESLFNIIGPDISDSSFLDLFGGTGSVGIEALSRGAQYLRILDVNQLAVATIKQNLIKTRLADKAEVIQGDSLSYIKHSSDRSFDYIYIAPPQYKQLWIKTLNILDENISWINKSSWVIVQIDPVEYENFNYHNLEEFDTRRYGSTLLVFYELKLE